MHHPNSYYILLLPSFLFLPIFPSSLELGPKEKSYNNWTMLSFVQQTVAFIS